MYGDDTLESVRQQIRTPLPTPKAEPKFNAWGLVTAIPRGIGEASAQVMGTAVEVVTALKYMRDTPTKDMPARVPVEAMQSDFADSLRDRGREFRPDPETAHAAEQVLYGFARGASKVIGGAVAAGPAGVVAAGVEEGVSAADDLKRQGVTDPNVRAKAGMVQGAGLALAALPVVGQTAAATAGLYAVGGPGGFMAQQALTRKILADAGHGDVAAQFDPLDPVGLAVSALIPGAFAVHGIRGQRKAAAAKADAELIARTKSGEQTGTATAARDAYSPEVVDAARVAYAVEQRAAANPQPWSMRSADIHEQALSRAEDAMARGEPVQVADLYPPRVVESLESFLAANKIKDDAAPPEPKSDFLAFIKQAGGIDMAAKFDVTGERSGVLSNPAGIFRNGGRGLDDVALQAEAAGYLRPGADTRDFVEMVQNAVRGERVLTMEQQMAQAARDHHMATQAERLQLAEDKLRLLGVDPAPAGGNVKALEAYLAQNQQRLLGAALDELRAADNFSPEGEAMRSRARQIVADMQDGERTLPQYEADVESLSPAMRRLVQEELDAAAQAPTAPPQGRAPEAAAPQGKPRDLRAELIALRKEESVLNKLLECLNG